MKLLTKRDLARRWGVDGQPVCDRTVRRQVARFGLLPKTFTGQEPLYALTAVERMEKRKAAALLKQRERLAASVARANKRRAK